MVSENVSDELAAIGGFLRLLNEERTALVANDVDSIRRLAKEKEDALVVLQQFAQKRLRPTRLPQKAHPAMAITACAASRDIREAWLKVQRLNQTNQEMLRMHSIRVDRALSVLRQTIGGPTTYGARGYLSGAFLFAPAV